MSALVTVPPCEEPLLAAAAAERDNCRINENGEITGQFARNDRCRGSITGCELRRRLKLLLVQKRQRLGSFLHRCASPFSPSRRHRSCPPCFPAASPISLTSVAILPKRNPRVLRPALFPFLRIFAFRVHLFLSLSVSLTLSSNALKRCRKLSKTKRGEALFRIAPRV